ncbi:MAG TPA: prepilin-type N-terminal cleavage/methylation domain-containing protein [Synergistales bacterium]|nr:prepilin-type N-terminal cleavage/methylation domain-containing protein [Synergistales bacterium]
MRQLLLLNKSKFLRGKGFTLVELLIVMVIGLVVAAGIFGVFFVFILDFEQTDDITAARTRGEMVLSILEGPILHAGLAMPDSTDVYSGDQVLATVPSWSSFIEITGAESDELHVLYAMETGIYSQNEVSFDVNDELFGTSGLSLSQNIPDSMMSTDSTKTTGWILFPTSNNAVFEITGNNQLNARTSGGGFIAQYDNVHTLRALRAYLGTNPSTGRKEFYTQDVTVSSGQPRVDGIEKIFFEMDGDVFSVYILARGNKQGVDLDPNREIDGWPDTAGYNGVDRTYRLSVTRGSWRIRN